MLRRRLGGVLAHEAIGLGHGLELGDSAIRISAKLFRVVIVVLSFRWDGSVAVVVDERTSHAGSGGIG